MGRVLIIVLSICYIMIANGVMSQNNPQIEARIESILSEMTLQEKIGQTCQRGKSSKVKELPVELKEAVRNGMVGSLLNIMEIKDAAEIQRIAVEESPRGIPVIFGRDVIHGFKTIFPIPLGQAATFNPELVKEGAHISAVEASAVGIRWTFAPMLDIARDPRWGRIAESAGEDPYLSSKMAEAYVNGFQGGDLSLPTSIAACAKHFVGYGAAEGGRDYNTAIIHDQLLHNVYLKPFKTAVDNGVATIMTSFNELNGVPASGNKYILKDVLRDQWNFDGFVVSDWNSIIEMIPHGFAEDEKEAAMKAANAGLDMEMTSTSYEDYLKELIQEGKFSEEKLDQLVRNILRIKFRLGLFENPYFKENKAIFYSKNHLKAAKETAIESIVLLKNENQILPLKTTGKKIAVIGPLANAPHEQLGTWVFDGEKDHSVTPLEALKDEMENSQLLFSKGLEYSRDKSDKYFKDAIKKASEADVILFFGGEESILSGEAHSRANINLPGAQLQLFEELHKTGKPIVFVLMAGRPITLEGVIEKCDAIVCAWHPGTMGGPAISEVLLGKVSPSGRLPVSWPKMVGQIPIHYNHKNTGRPPVKEEFVGIDDIPVGAWQSSLGNDSHYLDAGFKPQFPFGYGLSYGSFLYENMQLSEVKSEKAWNISIDISNTSSFDSKEVVQLYMQDVSASITRPVKQLIGFQKVFIKAGEKKTVSFRIDVDDLAFYNLNKKWVTEPGKFNIWISQHSSDEKNHKELVFN